MKRLYSIIPLLVLMVLVKWPIESSILKDRKEFKYNTGRFDIKLRQQMPQLMAIALLGGFRGVVCDFVWITAHGAWEKQEWFKMKQYFITVTTLQPMSVLYWETSAWHMGWNISYSVSQDPKEPRAAVRENNRRLWIEEARKLLERGVENIPERYNLYFHTGWLIMQKQDYMNADPKHGYPGKHFVEAAEWFKKAWKKFPDEAPTYISRMGGHCYMKAERWKEAREWWCELQREDPERKLHPDQMWYKIEEWGRECEDKLNIPADQRCFPPRKG
jgi:hypothetical protein